MAFDLKGATPDATMAGTEHLFGADSQSDTDPKIYTVAGLKGYLDTIYQPLDSELTSLAGASANGVSLVTAANYAAMRGLLDLEPNTDFYAPGGTDVALADGGTGASLADPGADRIMAWDDSAGAVKFIPLADINAEGSPAAGDFLLAYTAEGALVKIDWDDLPSGGGGTPGGSSGDIQYNNGGSFGGSLLKQDTNTIEQYNSTNAQQFNIYNTRTDASNYERGFMRWSSNALRIGNEKAGTGSARNVILVQDGNALVTLNNFTVILGGTLDLNVNAIRGHRLVENSRTSDGTETTPGSFINNRGATGTVTRTLSAANIDNCWVQRIASHALRIKPPSGGFIRRANGVSAGVDKYIELGSDGASCFIHRDGANLSVLVENGTITNEP
jgi:hypothetical protein